MIVSHRFTETYVKEYRSNMKCAGSGVKLI
jgi:hypothetical protein